MMSVLSYSDPYSRSRGSCRRPPSKTSPGRPRPTRRSRHQAPGPRSGGRRRRGRAWRPGFPAEPVGDWSLGVNEGVLLLQFLASLGGSWQRVVGNIRPCVCAFIYTHAHTHISIYLYIHTLEIHVLLLICMSICMSVFMSMLAYMHQQLPHSTLDNVRAPSITHSDHGMMKGKRGQPLAFDLSFSREGSAYGCSLHDFAGFANNQIQQLWRDHMRLPVRGSASL